MTTPRHEACELPAGEITPPQLSARIDAGGIERWYAELGETRLTIGA